MYTAKAAGGGTFAVEAATVSSPKRDQLRLEGHLHRALENDELRVHYQPQVELSTGRITGAEALIRWEHPTEGLLLPGSFLPLAEKTGLVVAMDRSEEHTSELQSLMRSSYAVYCLKKKKKANKCIQII